MNTPPMVSLTEWEGAREKVRVKEKDSRGSATRSPPSGGDAEGGGYPERACVGCCLVADEVAHPAHLNARDTTLAFVSGAPQAEIKGLKARMGWDPIPWCTLTDDFDADVETIEVSSAHGPRTSTVDALRVSG